MTARIGAVGFVTVSLRRSLVSRGHTQQVGRAAREGKARRARRIVAMLEKAMPEAKIALDYGDELQLLVAVMLSAQCTDAVVNTVTPALFARYPTAADYARASPEELMEMLRRVGLFRTKARNVV